MSKLLQILIIEDNTSDALPLMRELQGNGFEVSYMVVDNATDMEVSLKEQEWDLILSDFSLSDFDAIKALEIFHQHGLDIPFIVVSDTVGEEVAVAAMKAGAKDFIPREKLTRLTPAIEREVHDARERRRRREVELQFYQSEDRFAKAFHGSPIGIAISRISDGKAIDINERFTEMFGFKREDIIGKSASELNLWSSDEQRKEILQQLHQAGSINNVEVGLRRASGEEGYALLSLEIIELHNEPCILTMGYDITASKQAEVEIKRSNELIGLMRDIATTANEATDIKEILQFTIDCICTYTGWDVGHAYIVPDKGDNLEAPPIWHITEDERFKDFRHYTETTFDATHNLWIRGALASNELQWIEDLSQADEFVRADIATRCGLRSAYAFPIISHQKITGVFEFFSTDKPDNLAREIVDIATHAGTQVGRVIERQRAQKALNESEKQFRLLAENSTDLISRHTLDGIYLYASPASRELLGYEPEELLGRSAYDFFHPDDLAEITKSHDAVLEFPEMYTASYRIRRKDGTYIWFETTSHTLRDMDTQQAIEIHTSSRDITERNRIHETERIRRTFAEALHNTTTEIMTDNLDLDAILERILQYAGELTPCDTASLMIVEDDTARVVHCYGFPEGHIPEILNMEIKVSQIPNFYTMGTTREPLLIQDTSKYVGWRRDILSQEMQINSYIGAPIFVGDRLFGFINLDATETDRFTLDHVEQLALLAGQAAVAIHNAQLYQQIQQYTKRLELLHEIDRSILRADDPHAIGHAVMPRLLNLMDVHSASITLFDLEREEYTVLATTSSVPEYLKEGSRHKFGNSELIKFFEKNEVQIVNDLHESQNLSPTDKSLVGVQIRSYARIPLIAHGKLMGSINFRSTEPHAFNLEKLDIAREVSAQLAIAIASAHLLEIEQRHNSELTALHQASLHLTRTFDLDSVLDTIIDYAILLIKTSDAHIFLYDGEKLTFGAAQWNGKKQSKAFAEPRPQGLTYRVAQSRQRIVVNNMSEDPIFAGTSYAGAIIGLPLLMADTVIGVMTLAFDDTHYFEEEELRILELLADQAAIALHNSQLYEQIRLHNEELEQRVKARTRQLHRAKDRVEAILHNSSDSIILADKNGVIYQTNSGFNSQFGYDSTELFSQSLSTIATPEFVEDINGVIQDVVEGRMAKRLEIVAKRKDQTTYPADALFASYTEGDSVGIVCSLRDISLQKEVEEELRKALEKEKELNELKTSFTSIVSHEFRTPLAVILSTTELLTYYADRIDENRRQDKLQKIRQQVQRMNQLINDVLTITRSETIGFEFNPQPLDVVKLVQEMLDEVQVGHGENTVTIDFVHKGISELVAVDGFLLSHILQNLASNAIKYSHKGGQVQVVLTQLNGELNLRIEDEGIGMPDAYRSRLFESFQRASNVGDIQGTGIGLTIVKRAVDAHKGEIKVDSQEGVGTTFNIKLPISMNEFVF